MQVNTNSTKSILKQLDSIRGIDKCKDDILSFAKYIELNSNNKINFGNYNVLIKCNSEFIEAERLIELIEQLFQSNGIITSKHLYMEPRQLKTNLINNNTGEDTQLVIVSSEFVNLAYGNVQKDINRCIDENPDKIFVVLYRYKEDWWFEDFKSTKIAWTFELTEISDDDKISYVKQILNENGIRVDSSCNLINALSEQDYEDMQKELMQILIKCKSKNIDRITNKTLAELELGKYIKTKVKTRTISHTKKVGLQELHSLEGLDDVKQQVEQLVNFLQVNKKRRYCSSFHTYGFLSVSQVLEKRVLHVL